VVPEPTGQRRTRNRVFELVAFVLVAGGISVSLATWRSFFDLQVYWGAVHYWIHGGSIYDFIAPASTYGFTYSPFAALMLLPLTVLPWPVTIVASCVATLLVTLLVIYWFIDPVARRHGFVPWYAVGAVAACAIAFDPLRETVLFGQVNMYLVALVGFDLLFLVRRGSRFAGVGIGLATAFKLTPGVFLIYLLVTKRWRAAFTACSAIAGASLIGAAFAPDASRVFWTDALWNTDRVGQLDYISNQSLNGAVARLNPHDPSTLLWVLSIVAVLAVWAVRVRRAAAADDEKAGFALTGIVTCLISPITWVHHLVWVMPALLLLVDRAFATAWPGVGAAVPSTRRRAWIWGLLIGSYVVLGSRIVWAFNGTWTNPLVWFGSNAYTWVSLLLLIGLPVAAAPVAVAPQTPARTPTAAEPTSPPEPVAPVAPAHAARPAVAAGVSRGAGSAADLAGAVAGGSVAPPA
jgi:alpha-1,2-mannosyltransferase